jgi:DNA-binding GntR family transcriptional regulator
MHVGGRPSLPKGQELQNDRSALQPNMTAQQHAYIHIQDQIVSGVLIGGTRLKPETIAHVLGISRMPVREAIRQLDAEGYVTIRPNRGAVVKTRSRDEVVELFEMRAALEGLAVRLGARRATSEMLDDLEMLDERLRRTRSNRVAWVERHDQFHDEVCATSGRQQLRAECRRLRLALSPYLRLYMKVHGNPERPGFEHVQIIEALRQGEPDIAERVMRDHVMANSEGIAECLRLSADSKAQLAGEYAHG